MDHFKLNWKPISECPTKPHEFEGQIPNLARGTLLRYTEKSSGESFIELLGDDLSGGYTTGCACCSVTWRESFVVDSKLYEIEFAVLPIDEIIKQHETITPN